MGMTIKRSGNTFNQKGVVVWLSGLPCSGKTTIGTGLEKILTEEGFVVRMLDGDVTRKGICSDLGFSERDRKENIRRVAEIARLFAETGVVTICAFITPTDDLRKLALDITGKEYFVNVFVNTSLEVCEQRDVKGMYRKARLGQIAEFTGVSAPFEIPVEPDIVLNTFGNRPEESATELYNYLIPLIACHEKQI